MEMERSRRPRLSNRSDGRSSKEDRKIDFIWTISLKIGIDRIFSHDDEDGHLQSDPLNLIPMAVDLKLRYLIY